MIDKMENKAIPTLLNYSGIKVMVSKYTPADTMIVDEATYLRLKKAIENNRLI